MLAGLQTTRPRRASGKTKSGWRLQDPEGRDDRPDGRERRARRLRAHLRRPEPPARLLARPPEPGRRRSSVRTSRRPAAVRPIRTTASPWTTSSRRSSSRATRRWRSLSSLPIRPEHSAESIQVRDKARRISHAVCHDDRLLMQGEAHPTLVPARRSGSPRWSSWPRTYPLAAWKVYTHEPRSALVRSTTTMPGRAGGRGLHPQGRRARDPAHLRAQGAGERAATPRRSTSVPRRGSHPDVAFLVYHSGFDIGGSRVRTGRRPR